MKITFRQLECFVAAVTAGSLTGAAGALHVTPTALSLQIKQLEVLLNSSLMKRHSRGVVPTAAGEELHKQALTILDLVTAVEASAIRTATPPLIVRLGAPPPIIRLIGVDAIKEAALHLGTTELQLFGGWTRDLERRLLLGELDCVVGYEIASNPELDIVPLLMNRFNFAAAPSIAGGYGPISLAEALATPLVYYGKDSVGWRVTQAAAQAAGLDLLSERYVGSIDVWRGMLCRGLGTTITTIGAIADEHARGEIAVREIADHRILRMISLAIRTELRHRPWAKAMPRFIKQLMSTSYSVMRKPLLL